MAGGPSVNIAIAFFVFWGVFAFYGNPSDRAVDAGQPVVATVNDCVIPYAEQRTKCKDTDPISPAAEAGLQRGDVITSFNGTAVTGYDQLQALIRDNDDGEAVIGFLRNGVAHMATTHTLIQRRPVSDALRQAGQRRLPRHRAVQPLRHRRPGLHRRSRWATPPSRRSRP